MPSASPPPIFLKIDRAMRAGRMDEAVRLARKALDKGLEHPVPLSLRAWWLERQDRPGEALADLERLKALGAANAASLTAMGRCLTALGQGDQALVHLAGAMALAPGSAGIWLEKGRAHEVLGDLLDARTAYEEALKRDPGLLEATARLAALAARRSDWDAARTLAGQVLSREPGYPIALLALATADLAAKDFVAAESRTRAVAQSPNTIPMARATALNQLGDALDGQDRVPEAFEAYAAANRLLETLFQPRFAQLETGLPVARRVAESLSNWTTDTATQPQGPQPVFLLGFARAGTSLLGQILGNHSNVLTLEEKPLMAQALDRFFFVPGGMGQLEKLPAAEAAHLRALYWEHVRQEAGCEVGERRVLDQTPLNVVHLPLIARLFPGATVLFAVRDPRDVVLSCFRRLFALHRYTYEFLALDRTAQFYDAAMQVQGLARQRLDLKFCDIRNEELVADFDGETRRMCDALNLPWEPALADFAQTSRRRAVATPSATQIARGLNADGIGQWRRYEQQMRAVLPLLEPWARHFGYDA